MAFTVRNYILLYNRLSAIQQEFSKLSEDKPDLVMHISTLREKVYVIKYNHY